MSDQAPRIHLASTGQRFTLCGNRSARRTLDIRKVTCSMCRELHRQHAQGGMLWSVPSV